MKRSGNIVLYAQYVLFITMIYHCLRVACLLSLAYICDSFIIDRSLPRTHIYRTDDRSIASIQLSAYFNKRSDSSGRKVKADEDARQADGRISNGVQKATAPKSLAQQNILGQNIINCRQFSLDSSKVFDFVGSFKSLNSIPIYSIPEIAFIGINIPLVCFRLLRNRHQLLKGAVMLVSLRS